MGATVKDIAAMAGVSPGTVDRALHNRGRVSPEVAARIQKIAKELNYRPNTIAKGLSRRKEKARIAIILHLRRTNTYFEEVLIGIKQGMDEVADYGVEIDIKYCDDFSADSQLESIQKAIDERVSGMIVVPICDDRIAAKLNEATKAGIPVVFLTNLIEGVDYSSFVGNDYRLSGSIAAGLVHLCSQGGGRLIVFMPSMAMYGHVLRLEGMKETLAKEYPDIELVEVVEMSNNELSDYKLAMERLAAHSNIDLIICPGAFGTGCLTAIRDSGLFGKAKIVAFDCSRMIQQALKDRHVMAIITQQPTLQGYTAVKTIFSIISGNGEVQKDNYIKTRILLKEHFQEG